MASRLAGLSRLFQVASAALPAWTPAIDARPTPDMSPDHHVGTHRHPRLVRLRLTLVLCRPRGGREGPARVRPPPRVEVVLPAPGDATGGLAAAPPAPPPAAGSS